MIDISYELERLLKFAQKKDLISPWDVIPTRNALMEILKIQGPYKGMVEDVQEDTPVLILKNILDYGVEEKLIEEDSITERDLLDSKIMGQLLPRQSEIISTFFEKATKYNIKEATDWFYELCKSSNYIMTERVEKNPKWYTETPYGNLEITINLAKPEKDPKEISKAKQVKEVSYPKCFLCIDNVGYAGRLDHPGRQNLRVIPLTLGDEQWFFQYSPYVYYNEHCIVFKGEHEPMNLNQKTIERLMDFVDQFPHYFIGSNADLPIVGGSILTHDHYQGGRHKFPIEEAKIHKEFKNHPFEDVRIAIVNWPMSVIRIKSSNREKIIAATMYIYSGWKIYRDLDNDIIPFTKDTPHNTITPIVRKKQGEYEVDIVLRNNRTSKEHSYGIFHPHSNLHHIKKENIGLIEVMGLAVLPGRLEKELGKIAAIISKEVNYERSEVEKDSDLSKHICWIEKILDENKSITSKEEAHNLLRKEVGIIFSKVLEDAGVFKRNESGSCGFEKFLGSMDIHQ